MEATLPLNAAAASSTAPTQVRWKIFLMMLFLISINYIDRASLSVAMPLIAKEFDIGPALQGLLLGVDQQVAQWIEEGNTRALAGFQSLGTIAQLAHPSHEHFLPLLVAAGAASTTSPATVLDGGIRHGVLAMESYVFGRQLELEVKEQERA